MQGIRARATRKRGAALILALAAAAVLLMALATRASGPAPAAAASHREAPLISLDPEADITDFFMFRSYEPGQSDKVELIMDVIPGEEPSAGPNYYNFDPSVLYTFNVDNNNDGKADDIRFELSFRTELRGDTTALGLPLAYTAIPPITHLDGAGSEGLGVRQRYTLTMVKNKKRTVLADGLFAVPSNVGPRTMPNYQQLVDVRVQLRVEALDPLQIRLDELDRGDLAAAHELGLLGRGQEGDAVHSIRSSIWTAITGPPGGRSRYCGYLAASSSTARGSSTMRAVPRNRAHQSFDQSSSYSSTSTSTRGFASMLRSRWSARVRFGFSSTTV
jgi:hypothetical protein